MPKKSTVDLIQHLTEASESLTDAQQLFMEKGRKSALSTIRGELRALVVSGGRSMTPLLLNLSDKLAIPLELYSRPRFLPKDACLHILGGQSWSSKPRMGLAKYCLSNWLDQDYFLVPSTGDYRSRMQMLKHLANHEGGGHYSEELKPVVATLRSQSAEFRGVRYTGEQVFLIDMCFLVRWLIVRLLATNECRQSGGNPETDNRIAHIDNVFENCFPTPFGISEIVLRGRMTNSDQASSE